MKLIQKKDFTHSIRNLEIGNLSSNNSVENIINGALI